MTPEGKLARGGEWMRKLVIVVSALLATEGPVGYILGGYTSRKGEPDDGKFTLTLRQASDGRWLIFSDMDNGNARRRE
jgi:hypothetical protein